MCRCVHMINLFRFFFFFSSRRRHTRFDCDWSSDVCSSDLWWLIGMVFLITSSLLGSVNFIVTIVQLRAKGLSYMRFPYFVQDRKSTRLNSSHSQISYAVFCLKKKKTTNYIVVYWYHRLCII